MRLRGKPYPRTYTNRVSLITHGVREDHMHTLCGIPLSSKAKWGGLNRVPLGGAEIMEGDAAAANPVTCNGCKRTIRRDEWFSSDEYKRQRDRAIRQPAALTPKEAPNATD